MHLKLKSFKHVYYRECARIKKNWKKLFKTEQKSIKEEHLVPFNSNIFIYQICLVSLSSFLCFFRIYSSTIRYRLEIYGKSPICLQNLKWRTKIIFNFHRADDDPS